MKNQNVQGNRPTSGITVWIMPRGLGVDLDLSWFYELAIADQVALLSDPHRRLPEKLASRIAAVFGGQVASKRRVLRREKRNGAPSRWMLAEPATRLLSDARKKLDVWWLSDSLSETERNYLIAHRGDEEPPAHAVTVELPVLRAYIEMKSRSAGRRLQNDGAGTASA